MTSAVIRGSISTQLPQTQNTAPVLEFRCLYTRDLRRKAKRWQDGFLKYHTFNRRVMVYDTLRSFIGDTFNPGGAELQEGDELDLEKDFVMVQVSEPVGVTQTDLTELIEQRSKTKDVGKTATPARTRVSQESSSVPFQKHRPLSAMLGTPKGPLGRAMLPTTSPFEERQKRKAHIEHGSSKRQKHTTGSAFPTSEHVLPESSLGSSPVRRSNAPTPKVPKPRPDPLPPKPPVVIDLLSDGVDTNDAVSPVVPRARPKDLSRVAANHVAKKQDAPRASLTLSESAVTPAHQDHDEEESQKRRPLRVVSNAPRKMLLCQQSKVRPDKQSQAKTPRDTAPARLEPDTAPVSKPTIEQTSLAPHQQRLQERLARLGQKKPKKIIISSTPDDEHLEDSMPLHPDRPPAIAPSPPPKSVSLPHALRGSPPPPQRLSPSPPQHIPTPARPVSAPQTTHTVAPAPLPPVVEQPKRQLGEPVQAGRRSSVPTGQSASVATEDVPKQITTDNTNRDKNTSVARIDMSGGVVALRKPATRTFTRSDSDPLAKPFKPPSRPIVQNAAVKAKSMDKSVQPRSGDPAEFGPWSREALDLFDWWPPDRDKQGNRTIAVASEP
ncbi:hypothetical protein C1H76_4782 [Elsinoe australis]|uniref:5'-3' DNA helicase ZGRF1-like N-terminal domain-containing protein n=1 Tax=Elsinoe australis TaxID=40998 RepID=A0A4U7AWX4_9PEZI|nr:hypothetical protein C1H76_4782 [Elsinoe australis]